MISSGSASVARSLGQASSQLSFAFRGHRFLVPLFAVLLAYGFGQTQAAQKFWDTTAGAGNGVGGTGTFGTTFSTTATGDASLTTAAANDDLVFQGTAGTVTFSGNQPSSGSFTTITFNTTGYTLTSDGTTARAFNGPISLAAGITLNINDSAATTNRTFNLGSNLTGGAASTLTIGGSQTVGNASRLNLNASGVTISVPITITGGAASGVVATAANTVVSGDITNNGSGLTVLGATSGNSVTMNGKVTGTASLQFSAGDSGGAGTVTLNAVSDYQGATFFNSANGGIIKLGIDNALPTGTDVTMAKTSSNGGILDLNGHDQTIGSLTSAAGGGSITNNGTGTGTNTLSIGGSASPAAFGLAITDGATRKTAVTRSGTGTTTLTSANSTYSGGTIIMGGTIAVLGGGATSGPLGTGIVTVNNGGTLKGSGAAATVIGATTLNSGGVLDAGNGTAAGVMTFNSDLNLQSGSRADFNLTANATNDKIIDGAAGTFTVGGTASFNILLDYNPTVGDSFDILDWTNPNFSGTLVSHLNLVASSALLAGLNEQWDTSNFNSSGVLAVASLASAPEPSRAILLLAGLVTVGMRRKRPHSVELRV